MVGFIVGTILGIFIGNAFGFVIAGIMSASSAVDRVREREERKQ